MEHFACETNQKKVFLDELTSFQFPIAIKKHNLFLLILHVWKRATHQDASTITGANFNQCYPGLSPA